MSKKRTEPTKSEEFCNDFEPEGIFKPMSGMDCTGLIPSIPQNDWQMESYNQMYNYIPGTIDKKPKKNDPIEM